LYTVAKQSLEAEERKIANRHKEEGFQEELQGVSYM
jgi:hypothetical protein